MLPKEIIYEVYNDLGNTDKRRLRQTSTKYDIQFKEKRLLEELIEDMMYHFMCIGHHINQFNKLIKDNIVICFSTWQ